MANNRKLDNDLREKYLKKVMELFSNEGEEVLQTNSNECAFPCVDAENNDKWIQIVVKVPTGSRDENGFDGYGVAESYRISVREKEEKRKEEEEKKAKKIERDKKAREAKAAKNGE